MDVIRTIIIGVFRLIVIVKCAYNSAEIQFDIGSFYFRTYSFQGIYVSR